MSVIAQMTDVQNPQSFSNRMRARRFAKFAGLCQSLPRPLRIVDIGGTEEFWRQRGWAGCDDIHITLINLRQVSTSSANIESVLGDATDLRRYGSQSFDVAFSNSVIEHLFTWENQQAMAREVQRIAKTHWVQTPNYWFPVEPHFHVPGWQWMPESMRATWLVKRGRGHRAKAETIEEALQTVREVRLLSGREVRNLFPCSTVWAERFAGLVKCWVAYGGFRTT